MTKQEEDWVEKLRKRFVLSWRKKMREVGDDYETLSEKTGILIDTLQGYGKDSGNPPIFRNFWTIIFQYDHEILNDMVRPLGWRVVPVCDTSKRIAPAVVAADCVSLAHQIMNKEDSADSEDERLEHIRMKAHALRGLLEKI